MRLLGPLTKISQSAYECLQKMTRTGLGVCSSMIGLKTVMKPTTITKIAAYQNSVTPYYSSVIAYDTYPKPGPNLYLSYSLIPNRLLMIAYELHVTPFQFSVTAYDAK